MKITVEQLEPRPVWQAFAALAQVPRPSKREEKARAHIREWAARHKLAYREDTVGNVVVDVPATPGHETAELTILQAHLDMVCEKNAGTEHDFDRDPIRLIVDRDGETGEQIVRADGTTLGADNGLGVALMIAAATTAGVVHGPLELLFTSDEEAGMTSARGIAPDAARGRRMINLDSEEDDALYIGCAGGRDSTIQWRFAPGPFPRGAEAVRIDVAGLRGGHSGCDIHLNRVSAIKLLADLLSAAGAANGLRIAEIRGGSKRNVIPREAGAIVVGAQGVSEKLREVAMRLQTRAREAGETACEVRVAVCDGGTAPAVLSVEDSSLVLRTLTALPHGVLAVVPEIAGQIQTSNSTSTIISALENGALTVTVGCLSRSSSISELQKTIEQIDAIASLAGAAVSHNEGYGGWQPNPRSALLAACERVYERCFGVRPRVAAIHAGLECAILDGRFGAGRTDMISFGPTIKGAHSPDERVYVASVAKIWKYLEAVLAELA